jgi:hypothetical protein
LEHLLLSVISTILITFIMVASGATTAISAIMATGRITAITDSGTVRMEEMVFTALLRGRVWAG